MNQKGINTGTSILIGLLIIAAALAIWGWTRSPAQAPADETEVSSTGETEQNPQAQTSQERKNVYTNEAYGFSIELPEGWKAYPISYERAYGGLPPASTEVVEGIAFVNMTSSSIPDCNDTNSTTWCYADGGGLIRFFPDDYLREISDESQVNISGSTFIYFESTPIARTVNYLIERNSQIYRFEAQEIESEDVATLQNILSTLTFTK